MKMIFFFFVASALAALNHKFCEGVITRWHKMAKFMHPAKKTFKGMALTDDEKKRLFNNICLQMFYYIYFAQGY